MTESLPVLHFTRIGGFRPLDTQIGVSQNLAEPKELSEVLWAGRDDKPASTCLYAILDGGRVANLPEVLEGSGRPHVNLFQGRAAEEMADVAPWLVELAPRDRLTRNFFTQTRNSPPWEFWAQEPGILIRTRLDIEALRRHFRRFMRVRDERHNWYFFRFWEPSTAVVYFPALHRRPEIAARWYRPRDGGAIDALIICRSRPEPSALVVRPGIMPELSGPDTGFTLSDDDLQLLRRQRLEDQLEEMSVLLATTFAEETADITPADLLALTRNTTARMYRYGFRQRELLFLLLSWELFFGPGFENRDPGGEMLAICRQHLPEREKFSRLSERMQDLDWEEI